MLSTAYALAQTLKITTQTLAKSVRGRLTPEYVDELLAGWSRRVLDNAKINLVVGGAPVDWARGYVVMSNHQSHFDIPVLYRVVHGRMRMVGKTEIFRIPLFGPAMRAAQMIEIDRGNRESAIESLRAAGELIRGGVSVWIAPEGTRSKTGEIGKLKKGGFVVAVETGAPILPVAISHTHQVLPPGAASVRRGKTVEVTFGEPIEVEGRTIPDLMAEVRGFFEKHAKA